MTCIVLKSLTRSEWFSIAMPSLLERPSMTNYFKGLISQIYWSAFYLVLDKSQWPLWLTSKPCSTKSLFLRSNMSSYVSYGGQMETWQLNLRNTEWPFTPSELFRHRAALSPPCKRQQTIMKKNTEVRLQAQCTKTSMWMTASVLLAPKLKPRNTSKVCIKYVQKVDFTSLSSSATKGVSSSPFPRKNVPKMWKH